MKSDTPAIRGGIPVRAKDDFLIFGSPVIEEEEINEVVETLRSGWIGTGPKVAKFEESFREFKKKRFAIALNSCTAALHLSMLAAGIGPGDEVITTAMTFCATINAIIHAGAKPILADVNINTMNIDPSEIEKKITSRTRAILPVHFAGRPCDMDEIADIAKRHGLIIMEDCAHALEAEYKGKMTGTFGDFGCFSFYVTKNIITGEGGMVVTDDEDRANRIKILGLHGMSKDAWKRFGDDGYKHYYVTECGFKYNMMDLQASLGIHQIKRIDRYWEKRERIWEQYNSALSDLPLRLPHHIQSHMRHSYHLYTIIVDQELTRISRDHFLDAMTAENIGVGVHYLSIPEHPFYQQELGCKPEDFPNAKQVGRNTVSLPLSPRLTDKDVDDVIFAVRKIIASQGVVS